jgi:SpoVK/Ycf46/Vps4 family AAA+-type ATPase
MSPKKKMIVKEVAKLTAGTEIMLDSFQISVSDPAGGEPLLINAEIIDVDVEKKNSEYKLAAGAWKYTYKEGLIPLELREETFFETKTSTELTKHVEAFFKNVGVYEKYNRPLKRGVLLGGDPGTGKSVTLQHYCIGALQSMEGLCVIRIDGSCDYDVLSGMFVRADTDKVKRVILVIEDIGGATEGAARENVSSTMLNFLSGGHDIFKIPTLILATTNFLQNMRETLCDRPGRFDCTLEVQPPKHSEVCFLVEKTIARALTDAEKETLARTEFTPAYCVEAVIRSELYGITLSESVEQLKKQHKRAKVSSQGNACGFGHDSDD